MTFQLTTTQALKSFSGAAIFGLGLDVASLVSSHLTQAFWFVLREAAGLVFWGVLSGWQLSHAEILHSLPLLGCPVQLVQSLDALVQLLGSAV